MDMFAVVKDPGNLDSVTYIADETQRIARSVAGFLLRLAKVCEDSSVKERWATTLAVSDDGVSAVIDSPFGRANGDLKFVVTEEDKVEGRWVIRKHSLDSEGHAIRLKVASFRILLNGHIFLGSTQEVGIPATSRTAYQVMSGILYALGRSED
jgi:hypothetical protein